MDEKKDMIVKVTDFYSDCLSDKINNNKRPDNSRPQGFVEIFELTEDNKKKLLGKHNLVVYLGREWLISRAFNLKNEYIDPDESEFICWFGVGDGGAPIGDPFDPTSPTLLDSDLSNPVMINASDSTCSDYRLTPDVGYYKHPFDSLNFEQDSDNYNRWLIIRVVTTLGADDANGFNINEIGLFTAASDSGGYSGPFNLYARTTFPTISKIASRQLIFVWYVYF